MRLRLSSIDHAVDHETVSTNDEESRRFIPRSRTLRTTSMSLQNVGRTEVSVMVRKPSWRKRITSLVGSWADKYANRYSQEQSEIVAIQQIAQRDGFVHTYRCEHGHIHLLDRQRPPQGEIKDGIGQCPFKRPRRSQHFGPDPYVGVGWQERRDDGVRMTRVASRT
jgi:hypothetical protein